VRFHFSTWYVIAATPPKDIVILIDTSAAMLWNNKLSLAKDIAMLLIKTANPYDEVFRKQYSKNGYSYSVLGWC